MFRSFITAMLLTLLAVTLTAAQSAPATAEQRLEGLLEAMGGRAAWASLTGVRVTATHYTTRQRLPHKNVIWNDFNAPRLRIEASSAELDRALGLEKVAGWRRDRNEVRSLTEQEAMEEHRWWESNPYRTLHRLARRDSELSVRLLEPDRLGVFRKDGVRLNWFRLNQANEPIAFGTWDAEDGSVFGPLVEAKFGIKHPRWVARPDGRWRAELGEFLLFRDKVNFETKRPG